MNEEEKDKMLEAIQNNWEWGCLLSLAFMLVGLIAYILVLASRAY